MPRRLAIALVLIGVASSSYAQGIRGVTRRTTTLERQQPARMFFDAAGLHPTGTPAPQAAGQRPIAAFPASNLAGRPPVARPPVVLPPISQRIARPQVAQGRPGGTNSTPRVIVATPPPAKSHAKP